VPPFALKHGDPFCSVGCMQVATGVITVEEWQAQMVTQSRSAHDPDKVQQAPYRNRHKRRAA
jgi:hypothetical protein